jgi:regulator of protease activity HflC (stomatin/prohibitin superfamily)
VAGDKSAPALWGVKVANVEVKQVDLPESMLRAMAKQAEMECEKRSKIIHAEGESLGGTAVSRCGQLAGRAASQRSAPVSADTD